MPLPNLSAGHKVLASEWQTIEDFILTGFARKSSDESVTSSTTLQDDNDLQITVGTNATYFVECHIIYQAATTGDLQVGWSGPTGATFDWNAGSTGAGATAGSDFYYWGTNTIGGFDTPGGLGAGTSMICRPSGILITSSTSGLFKFRWAQGTSSGTSTIVKAGSAMFIRRLA